MSDSLNICLPCGLCCDGTLIGHVQLENDELNSISQFKEIEEESGKGFFLQPCKNFCENACNIYPKRPKQCASFECGLLKSIDLKELSFTTALEIIEKVKQKRDLIENKIALLPFKLKSLSFHFKMAELKIYLQHKKSKESITSQDILLINELKELNDLLEDKFDLKLN